MSEELRPCPHCEKSIVECIKTEYSDWQHQVYCGACGSASGIGKRERIIEHWNKRVPDPAVMRLVEAANDLVKNQTIVFAPAPNQVLIETQRIWNEFRYALSDLPPEYQPKGEGE